MKLTALIAKLEKAKTAYEKKHGIEPVIWSWNDDELELCARRQKIEPGYTRGHKPYMVIKIKCPGM